MAQQKKNRARGRPNLPKGAAKAETLRVRVAGAEMVSFQAKAKRANMAFPAWVRKCLTEAQ